MERTTCTLNMQKVRKIQINRKIHSQIRQCAKNWVYDNWLSDNWPLGQLDEISIAVGNLPLVFVNVSFPAIPYWKVLLSRAIYSNGNHGNKVLINCK